MADKQSSQVIGKRSFALLSRQDRQGFGLTRPARRWRSLADMAVLADMVVVGGHVCNRRPRFADVVSLEETLAYLQKLAAVG